MKAAKTYRIQILLPLFGLFILLWAPVQLRAGSLKQIELSDGSVIRAEIVSITDGIYTLRSKDLGTLSLPEEKIKTIRFAGTKPARGDVEPGPVVSEGTDSPLLEMRTQMLGDPETMKLIQKLQQDPSIQHILQDKELMRAIESGDLSRVASDPKIQSLMQNKTVGEIIERSQ